MSHHLSLGLTTLRHTTGADSATGSQSLTDTLAGEATTTHHALGHDHPEATSGAGRHSATDSAETTSGTNRGSGTPSHATGLTNLSADVATCRGHHGSTHNNPATVHHALCLLFLHYSSPE
jgi:hypothetical protein